MPHVQALRIEQHQPFPSIAVGVAIAQNDLPLFAGIDDGDRSPGKDSQRRGCRRLSDFLAIAQHPSNFLLLGAIEPVAFGSLTQILLS